MNNIIEIELKTKGTENTSRDIKTVRENIAETAKQSGIASNSMETLSNSLAKTSGSLSQVGKSASSVSSSFSNMTQNALSFASSIITSQNYAVSNSLSSQYNNLKAQNDIMLEEYDKSILEIEEKYKAMKASLAEEDSKSLENMIASLETEKEYSFAKNDIVAGYAVEKRIEELEAKKSKEDVEKKIEEQRLKEIKGVEDAKAKASENARREEAMIQYQRDKANYENSLANAKMNSAVALADAISQPAMAVLNVASGTAKSFAQGGIPGGIAGAVMGVGILGSVLGSLGSAIASANNIKSLESNPPEKPAFAYGTEGYMLKSGQSAIVGEMGEEIVHNRGGELVVKSSVNTKELSSDKNITLNFYGITMNEAIEEIKDFLRSYKDRDVVYMS